MSYRKYLLVVLASIGGLTAAEPFALGLVLQNVKHDLFLTDAQLGLLTGFGFALFYALAGLGVARWADRGNRVAIVSLSMIAWGIFFAACGLARNFWQLILLRVGLAIGEAGYSPVTQSLIADSFKRTERVRANAVSFAIVTGLAQVVGYGVAGRLNEVYGWRLMFMILGIPGLIMAIVAWLTLREPRFNESPNSARALQGARADRLSLKAIVVGFTPLQLKEVVVTLCSITTMRHLLLFWSVWGFVSIGMLRWLPVFFVRSYGLQTGELGIWFVCVFGVAGTLGPLLGGAWYSRYAANDERLQLKMMALTSCGVTAISPFIYLTHNYHVALGLLGLFAMLGGTFLAAFWSIVQTVVPESMRASATAILLLLTNLFGAGFGPLAAGGLSDVLLPQFGNDSLRYASLALCPGFLWAAWHLWRASRSVTVDLAATQAEQIRDDRGGMSVDVLPKISC